jgi:NADH-quinone oxidoreductase subunit C
MEKNEILSSLLENFGNVIIKSEEPDGILTIVVKPEAINTIIKYLKEFHGFNFLTDLCGIHYPEQENSLGVIYHIHNLNENIRIRLKIFVPDSKPIVKTVTDLFPAANWMERETFDFFGIIFEGHPNLKRILNVEYLDYHPLRKEYPLEDPTRHDKDDRFFGR